MAALKLFFLRILLVAFENSAGSLSGEFLFHRLSGKRKIFNATTTGEKEIFTAKFSANLTKTHRYERIQQ